MAAGQFEPGGWQLDPPFKMPMWDLQPVYSPILHLGRERTLAADDQHPGAEGDPDVVRCDARQGDKNGQYLVGFENVEWGFPTRRGVREVEKLAYMAIGTNSRSPGWSQLHAFDLPLR